MNKEECSKFTRRKGVSEAEIHQSLLTQYSVSTQPRVYELIEKIESVRTKKKERDARQAPLPARIFTRFQRWL